MLTLTDPDAMTALDQRLPDRTFVDETFRFTDAWDPTSPGWEPSPEIMVFLSDVDPNQLDQRERVLLVQAWEKLSRYVSAQLAEAIAFAAGEKPEDRASDTTVFELAGLFHQPSGQMGKRVDTARDVVATFPDTLSAVERGDIPYAFAIAISELTEGLSFVSCQQVERRVLPGAEHRTLGQQKKLLHKVIADYEREVEGPAEASPSMRRRMSVRSLAPGLASMTFVGPSAQIAAAAAAIEGLVRAADHDQDRSTLDHQRFDAGIDLITGRQPINVDLVIHGNADGTFTIPSLPGLCDLRDHEIRKLLSGGTVRFFDPRLKPAPVERHDWTPAQHRYLKARDRRCRFPGCGVPAERCDDDHNQAWPAGQTDVDNGCCLCRRHHRMKHKGWKVQLLPDGTVLWTSPNGIQLRDPPHRD